MNDRVDYYISAVRTRGGHVTHVRVHKALPNKAFAPHGIVQPRSTLIVNLRSNTRAYRTLVQNAGRQQPGDPVRLTEIGNRFYLRVDESEEPCDNLGELPNF